METAASFTPQKNHTKRSQQLRIAIECGHTRVYHRPLKGTETGRYYPREIVAAFVTDVLLPRDSTA